MTTVLACIQEDGSLFERVDTLAQIQQIIKEKNLKHPIAISIGFSNGFSQSPRINFSEPIEYKLVEHILDDLESATEDKIEYWKGVLEDLRLAS